MVDVVVPSEKLSAENVLEYWYGDVVSDEEWSGSSELKVKLATSVELDVAVTVTAWLAVVL